MRNNTDNRDVLQRKEFRFVHLIRRRLLVPRSSAGRRRNGVAASVVIVPVRVVLVGFDISHGRSLDSDHFMLESIFPLLSLFSRRPVHRSWSIATSLRAMTSTCPLRFFRRLFRYTFLLFSFFAIVCFTLPLQNPAAHRRRLRVHACVSHDVSS